jgi:hypothetical protein
MKGGGREVCPLLVHSSWRTARGSQFAFWRPMDLEIWLVDDALLLKCPPCIKQRAPLTFMSHASIMWHTSILERYGHPSEKRMSLTWSVPWPHDSWTRSDFSRRPPITSKLGHSFPVLPAPPSLTPCFHSKSRSAVYSTPPLRPLDSYSKRRSLDFDESHKRQSWPHSHSDEGVNFLCLLRVFSSMDFSGPAAINPSLSCFNWTKHPVREWC